MVKSPFLLVHVGNLHEKPRLSRLHRPKMVWRSSKWWRMKHLIAKNFAPMQGLEIIGNQNLRWQHHHFKCLLAKNHHGFLRFPLSFPKVSCGFSYGFLWFFLWFRVVFPKVSYGISHVFFATLRIPTILCCHHAAARAQATYQASAGATMEMCLYDNKSP